MVDETQLNTAIEELAEAVAELSPYAALANLPPGASEHLRQKMQEGADFAIFLKTLVPDVDYGIIPGAKLPTLLQPGAQRIVNYLDAVPTFSVEERVERWGLEGEEPFFHYSVKCKLWRKGELVGEAEASANSLEERYGRRWMLEEEIPSNIDIKALPSMVQDASEPEWTIRKRTTTGPYGKPLSYWDAFDRGIALAKNDPDNPNAAKSTTKEKRDKSGYDVWWSIRITKYQVPNPRIADLVNTIMGMAEKRALVRAAARLGAVSGRFTIDVDNENAAAMGITPPPPGEEPPAAQQQPRRSGRTAPGQPPPPTKQDMAEATKIPTLAEVGPRVFGPVNWPHVLEALALATNEETAVAIHIHENARTWQMWMRMCLKNNAWDASTAPWQRITPTTVDSTATPGEATETE